MTLTLCSIVEVVAGHRPAIVRSEVFGLMGLGHRVTLSSWTLWSCNMQRLEDLLTFTHHDRTKYKRCSCECIQGTRMRRHAHGQRSRTHIVAEAHECSTRQVRVSPGQASHAITPKAIASAERRRACLVRTSNAYTTRYGSKHKVHFCFVDGLSLGIAHFKMFLKAHMPSFPSVVTLSGHMIVLM